jgi:hypothetical protein
MKKKLVFFLLTFLLLLGTSLTLCEIALRSLGYGPWSYQSYYANEPVMHEPDADLGWRNRPGEYVFPPYAPEGEFIRMTFLADGSRVTGPGQPASGPEVLLIGCSLTQGRGISDDETYGWKLQARFPGRGFRNFGTAGYGTYQSLLMLERVLRKAPTPEMVIYGFIEHHELRNVAAPEWLELLAAYQRGRDVKLPYALLGHDGRVVRHQSVRYPEMPVRERLASVALAERVMNRLLGASRKRDKTRVTEELLLEMNLLARGRGARFGVVLFDASDSARAHYVRFLGDHDLEFADCVFPRSPQMEVPGEGHPSGAMNSLYAQCIAEYMGEPE